MNFPLGGAFNSRINLNLREDKGWTYGARSGFSGDEYAGEFSFSSGIRADATDSALVEVMKELKNYTANGPTDEEVDFMKNAVGQRDALAYETGIQKAAFIGRILDYNLPANYVEQQTKILRSMTKEQMKAMAQKYLQQQKSILKNINLEKKTEACWSPFLVSIKLHEIFEGFICAGTHRYRPWRYRGMGFSGLCPRRQTDLGNLHQHDQDGDRTDHLFYDRIRNCRRLKYEEGGKGRA
jgi:hypothetical protein